MCVCVYDRSNGVEGWYIPAMEWGYLGNDVKNVISEHASISPCSFLKVKDRSFILINTLTII